MRIRALAVSLLLVASCGGAGKGDDDGCAESSFAVHNNSGAALSVSLDGGSSQTISNGGSRLFENVAPGPHVLDAALINVPNGYCAGDWELGESELPFDLGCERETFYCE